MPVWTKLLGVTVLLLFLLGGWRWFGRNPTSENFSNSAKQIVSSLPVSAFLKTPTPTPRVVSAGQEVIPPKIIPPPAVTGTPTPEIMPEDIFSETADQIRLKTAKLELILTKSAWSLSLQDKNAKMLWAEPASDASGYGAPGFWLDKRLVSQPELYQSAEAKQWFRFTRISAAAWQDPTLTLTVETDDPAGRTATVKISLLSPANLRFSLELSDITGVTALALSFAVAEGEQFFGLGQRQIGAGQRGQKAVNLVRGQLELDKLKGEGSYAPYPFFLSTKGYGLLAETWRRNEFDMAATNPTAATVLVEASNLNLIFFGERDPLQILQDYTAYIGRPPLPPAWNFGVWKTLIGGQKRVEEDARKLRDLAIPVSTLYIYDAVDSLSGTGWDTPVFKPILPFPYTDLAALNNTLHGLGYKTMSYVHEAVRVNTPRYREGLEKGYFLLNQRGQPFLTKHANALLDFSNPSALAWFEESLRRVLVDLNFDGAMADTGDLVPLEARFANGQSGYEMANTYPVLYAKTLFEASQKYKPSAVFLMRTSYLGSQSYQKAVWEGDLLTHWDWLAGLPATIPAALNRGISGSPYMGTEIAGFLQVAISQEAQKELYFRWTQYGAFNPIMRDILGNQDVNAVHLWRDADTITIFKKYARLHTDLFPYIYTLAHTAHQTGIPLMRHPYLHYPDDATAIAQDREYFLGENLLVAPIVTFSDRSRPVYLPQGEWVDFWSGEVITGKREITAQAPLDIIPLYVKAGAILPTLLEPLLTLAGETDPLDTGVQFKVYPHSQANFGSEFKLYDGTKVFYLRNSDEIELRVNGAKERPYRLKIPAELKPLEVSPPLDYFEGKTTAQGWWYEADRRYIGLNITAKDFTVRFKLK